MAITVGANCLRLAMAWRPVIFLNCRQPSFREHEPCLSQNLLEITVDSEISTYSQDVSSIAWIALFSSRGSTTIEKDLTVAHCDLKSMDLKGKASRKPCSWTKHGREAAYATRRNWRSNVVCLLWAEESLWQVFFLIWSMRSLLYTRLRSLFPIYLCSDQRSSCPSLASSCCPFLLWSRCADWLAPSMGLVPRQQRFTLQ